MLMKKIAWVTSDSFIDCDFDYDILKNILNLYDIDWYLLLPLENARYDGFDFSKLEGLKNLKITILKSKYLSGSIRRAGIYIQLYKYLQLSKADIYYINCPPTPFLVPLVYLLNRDKTIVTAHQGEVHKGFSNPVKHKVIRYLLYSRAKFVNMFSPSQAKLFSMRFRRTKVSVILLALKSFGKATQNSRLMKKSLITFLAFGHINYGKNIELLIEAACNLKEKGIEGFKVSINGMCSNWSYYEQKIKYPDLFDINIQLIKNQEIPDLFSNSHFLVQPYRIVTQSGPLKIAFNYNIPVICSNFPGFSDEVIDGVNGYLFEPNNVEALEEKMLQAIELVSSGLYSEFQKEMNEYTKRNYSATTLAGRYIEMFRQIV